MRLKSLAINNFGIYQDENTFSFPYAEDRKVSLVIGKNGSGKTTFLNSIKICLFGPMILRNRTITKNYEQFIWDKLNKNALKIKSSDYSISATFISHVHNYDGEFTITRAWDITDKFKETVVMRRNGIALNDQQQQSFFNALYHAFPLELFDLFYLDGEKIDQLSVLNSNIFDLLESSINIDLFKKLQSDLLTYAAKRINDKKIDSLTQEKESILESKSQINNNISNMKSKKIDLETSINYKLDELNNLKSSLKLPSATFDNKELNVLDEQIKILKRSIETSISKILPYTLVSKQLQVLLTNITVEQRQSENKVLHKALNSEKLRKHLTKHGYNSSVDDVLVKICEFYPTDDSDFTHRLSNDDFYSLKTKVESLLSFKKDELSRDLKQLKILETQHKKLTSKSLEYESIKATGELENLLTLQKEFEILNSKLNETKISITNCELNLETLEKQLKEIDNELWKALKKSNISNILNQIHSVLDSYIIKIKEKKISEIEKHTKIMFAKLIRKHGFINDFKIENNSIYLFDKSNNKLNHTNLSAGEKQLFVLSLLYAVLKSSERKVPLMFDTLLGRLDKEHRDNVFKEFITACPDQVIILATDSELSNIDDEFLTKITNTRYSIDFSKQENKMSELRL